MVDFYSTHTHTQTMLTITIHTDNAAFDGDLADEVHACLSVTRKKLREELQPLNGEAPSWVIVPIKDTNGNTVGSAEYRKA